MKKALLLFILIIPVAALSQTTKPIDGFMTVPFGSDSALVKKAFLSKGAKEDYSVTTKDFIGFKDFIFSDRKVSLCIVKFFNNKAYEADFIFRDFDQDNALSYYDDLAGDISAVYGQGELTNNFGKSETNSYRIIHLQEGDETAKTLWMSDNSHGLTLEFLRLDNSLHT